MHRRQQRLHAVATADLYRHHRLELAPKMLFHRRDGTGNQPAVDRPFQDDEGRAHHRHHRDGVVVLQLVDVNQVDPRAVRIETAQVQQRVIRAATASGAKNPGANGKCFDIL